MRTEWRRWNVAVLCVACVSCGLLLQGCKKKEQGPDAARAAIKANLPAGADPTSVRSLTFADITSLPDPPGVVKNDPRYENARIPAFSNSFGVKEGDVVKVAGYLHTVTLMGDGDYNLKFSAKPDSTDNYIVSEIPDDDDVTDRKVRGMVVAAREYVKSQFLGGKDASRQGTVLQDAPYVEITGQLYFGDSHAGEPITPDKQGLHRASNWQIHPGIGVMLTAKPSQ